ncbi:unnamed protein product [Medioppia subpectinata]|uniref:carbonic anhydrase n=1 Tax=Medioppia subpectinata TaxID=1979941 RepID=A0A7R9Q6U5_9ACAR|nr:unnamed protein product [Medioppia subpectinata]CAG2114998.1 unnamed protein product [Medioppia subpectinata]
MAQKWTYDEQSFWRQQFPSCGGRRQSPININTDKLIKDKSLQLKLIDYDKPFPNLSANNNGHTVAIELDSNRKRPQLSVGQGLYDLSELHFHWGDNNLEGTEHSIDNYFGSAELHFVHYNTLYGNLLNARQNINGVVVLTVISQLSRSENNAIQPIIKALRHITRFNTSATIANQIVFSKFLPLNKQLFFTYKGSLTTPPCSESVQWIIYADPIRMSPFQLSQFRRLHKREINRRIIANTRDIQKRHGREVRVSVPQPNRDSTFDDNNYNDIDY